LKKLGNYEIPKFIENEDTSDQNLWVMAKAVLRSKFIAMRFCIRKL
jgi:hypothetical protein